MAEAGTGVGKTFAYLVPTLLSGARALVSTATKSLQDQLFLRDIRACAMPCSVPVSVALLKGRGSYLCLHRWNRRAVGDAADRWAVRTLAQRWGSGRRPPRAATSPRWTGLDERSSVIPLVTSTRENCLGSECADFKQCHVVQGAREAMAADLVVVNHHLFFADMALRDTGVAELLPSVEVAVFDEAHQLPRPACSSSARRSAARRALDFSRDLLGLGLQLARGLDWQELAAAVERAARELRLVGRCGSRATARHAQAALG